MSVFFGDTGLAVDCVGVRFIGCLRGEGGDAIEVADLVEADTFVLLDVEMGLSRDVPGRIKLWRRVGTESAVAVVVFFLAGGCFSSLIFSRLAGDLSPLCAAPLSCG